MSLGLTEFSAETNHDSNFAVPGVTFLASTGDNGANSAYPAYSPNVVAVGGTTLQSLDSSGDYPGTGTNGEIGWSGSGGGSSQYEPEPSYQQSVQNTGFRTVPDISADADPSTGVAVYDPYNFGTATPWGDVGGTSLSSPLLAGMVAIVDQGRVQNGGETLSSSALLTALYRLEITKPSDFHDVLYGNNGFAAGPGYDMVTGIGSPNGSQLVPDLAATLPASPLVSIAIARLDTVLGAGRTEQFTATGTYSNGTTQDITKLVTWASATPSVATIAASGLATTLSAGTSVITASSGGVTSPGDTLTVDAPAFVVNTTTDDLDYADGKTSLREAILYANAFPGHVITFDPIVFSTHQTINLTSGLLELSCTTGTETITGPAAGVTVNAGGSSRVFQVDRSVTASISGMTITGGKAALGGGLYNEGTTTLSNCTVSGNSASGGGVGNYGSLTLTNCTVSGNSTSGGIFGGEGGGILTGSYSYTGATTALANCTVSGNSAGIVGGGLDNYGTTTLTNCTVSGNSSAFEAGGVFNSYYSSVTLGNTIVAGNTASSGPDTSGVFTSQGNNLIGKTDGSSGWVGSDLSGTIAEPLNPLLAPLGSFIGPTQTMALLPGSPAINAGSSGPNVPATDQRGLGRLGSVDIGAFESQGFTLTVLPGSTPQTSMIGTAFANPLAVSLAANNPIEPVNGGVVSFVADRSVTGATAIFTAPSAVIANGQAAVTAAPYNVDGSYTVIAAASGSSPASVSFALTNTGPVFAGLVVNTTSDMFTPGAGLLSLREAIAFANIAPTGNSTITFDQKTFKTPQTITLTGTQLELSNTAGTETITGPNKGVTVSGGGLSRVFQVDRGVAASISGLTMTGGNSGKGGALYDQGTTALTNCTVSGNSASQGGGGLFTASGGTTTLINCSISGNSATHGGGGMSNYGSLALSNCSVSGNFAYEGGGVGNYGSLALSNCTVSDNSASSIFFGGGGVRNSGYSGTATLSNCALSGNSASYGGALYSAYGAMATLSNCTISNNSASGGGGGVFNYRDGTATLTNCTIRANVAKGGGAITFDGGGGVFSTFSSTATLINCTVSGNSASGAGGGGGVKANERGTATLTNCTVSGNSATGAGGGVSNDSLSRTTLTNCTVSGNSASGAGGGVFNDFVRSTATLTNCTVSGNTAGGAGGGVSNNRAATATLTNCTISGNSASGGGGGVFNGGVFSIFETTATLTNCTVNGNSASGAGGGVLNTATLNIASTRIGNNQASGAAGEAGIGGGICSNGGSLTLSNSTVTVNTARGGAGANGSAGGNGIGGGVALENNATATISNTTFLRNLAQGGDGGAGANGGDGIGGGLAVGIGGATDTSSAVLSNSLLIGNFAQGGKGGKGANGGNASGGGVFVGAAGTAALDQFDVLLNQALAGRAGAGGSNGDGSGGGLYVTSGGVVTLKKSAVALNFASTSNNDIYGAVTYD